MTKLEKLNQLRRAGDFRAATLLAARFADLGPQRADILSAREAFLRPDFQRQISKDPELLIAAGIEAMRARWGDV